MTIPAAQLQIAKDLLLFGADEVFLDAAIAGEWEQQLSILCRKYDFFTEGMTYTPVVGQAIYSTPPNTTRIVSVFHQGKALGYTDQMTLALRDPDWELALPGTPRYWSYNAIPGETDNPAKTITPREFLITPAPDGAAASPGGLFILYRPIPTTVPSWLESILLYLTVGNIAGSDPNLVQPEKGEFLLKLAETWLQVARDRMQI